MQMNEIILYEINNHILINNYYENNNICNVLDNYKLKLQL